MKLFRKTIELNEVEMNEFVQRMAEETKPHYAKRGERVSYNSLYSDEAPEFREDLPEPEEDEQTALSRQEQQQKTRLGRLQKLGIIVGAVALVLLLVYLYLGIGGKMTVTIPAILTAVVLVAAAGWLLYEMQRCRYYINMIERKKKRLG